MSIKFPCSCLSFGSNLSKDAGLSRFIELFRCVQVTTARLKARVIWALAEHFNLEGLDPLLADDPEDPLNIIIDQIHKVMFNTDTSATVSNRCTTMFWHVYSRMFY